MTKAHGLEMDDEDRGLPSTIKEQQIISPGTAITINNVSMATGVGGGPPQANIPAQKAVAKSRRSSSKASSRSSSTESRAMATISPHNMQSAPLVSQQQQQQPTNIVLANTFQPGFLPFSISSLSNGLAPTQTFTLAGPAIKPAVASAGATIFATPQQQTLQFSAGSTAVASAQPTMTVMPQSLIMPAGGAIQSNGTQFPQFVIAPGGAVPGQTVGGGPMFQIIQQASQNGLVQQQPTILTVSSTLSTTTTTTINKNNNTRPGTRPTKQILPKVSTVTTPVATTASNTSQAGGGVRLIQTQSNPNTFMAQGAPATQQFVLNNGGQTGGTQIITNAQGTFLVPGATFASAQQPQFVIQGAGGGVGAVQPQMQFAIKQAMAGGINTGQQTVFVNNNNNNVVANQPQAFVISNSAAAAAAAAATPTPANNLVVTPAGGAAVRCPTPSFIIRPPAQQIISQSSGQPTSQTVPQRQQQPQYTLVQTANGPVLVQLPQPQPPPPPPPQPQPQTLQVGNRIISLAPQPAPAAASSIGNASVLPTIIGGANAIAANAATLVQVSRPSPVLNSLAQTSTTLPLTSVVANHDKTETKTTTASSTKDNSMILADLLKETGILSEISPPTSPKMNASQTSASAPVAEPVQSAQPQPQPQQQTVLMVPGVGGGTQNILLAPGARAPVVQQQQQQQQQPLRLTVAPDGTLLLLPQTVGLVNQLPPQAELPTKSKVVDPSGLSSSQPSPDSTTPSIDVSNNLPTTAMADAGGINNNNKPNESMVVTTTIIETTPMTMASKVTTIAAAIDGSNLVKIASQPIGTTKLMPVPQQPQAVPVATSAATSFLTIVDQSGVILTQISSANNQQIGELIEQQLSFLGACQNLTQPQKELLQEISNLKTKLAQIKSIANVSLVQSITAQAQQVLRLTPNIQPASGGSNQQSIAIATGPSGQIIITNPTAKVVGETVAGPSVGGSIASGGSNLMKPNCIPTLNLPTSQPSEAPKELTAPSTSGTSATGSEPSAVAPDVDDEETKQLVTILKAIQQQLIADQSSALNPDYRTPFRSKDDACKRLLRYHVFNRPMTTEHELNEFDELYEHVSSVLLYKKNQLFNKFSYSLLKESMKETSTCEEVMLNRLFVDDERNALQADRDYVAAGNALNLPPPPAHWFGDYVPAVNEESDEMPDAKRIKLANKELEESCQQSNESAQLLDRMIEKKLQEESQEDEQASKDLMQMLEAEDGDGHNNEMAEERKDSEEANNTHSLEVASLLDSYIEENSQHNDLGKDVDELLSELSANYSSHNDTHHHHNMSDNFINSLTTTTTSTPDNIPSSSNDNGNSFMDALDQITDDLDDQMLSDIITPSNYTNSSWPQLTTNTSQMSGGGGGGSSEKWSSINRFNEAEAEEAVASIMDNSNSMLANGGEELPSLDLSGLDEMQMDVQIDCAIKSIMMSSPTNVDHGGGGSMSSASSISMHHHHDHQHQNHHQQQQHQYQHHQTSGMMNNSSNYMSSYHNHSQSMRATMSFPSAPVNDPMLDEAVKSILG